MGGLGRIITALTPPWHKRSREPDEAPSTVAVAQTNGSRPQHPPGTVYEEVLHALPPPTGGATLLGAASVAGPAHLENGTPCQDSHTVMSFEGTVIAAVADGLGSKSRSADGSRTATRTAARFLRDRMGDNGHLKRRDLRDAILVAREAVKARARAEGRPIGDYATTLLLTCWDSGRVHWAQIGDGAILLSTREGHRVAKPEQDHEYANVTSHLLEKDWRERLSTGTADAARHLSLFTDGLQPIALSLHDGQWNPHEPFFDHCIDRLSRLKPEERSEWMRHFLGSPRAADRSGDDKTWVMVMRGE